MNSIDFAKRNITLHAGDNPQTKDVYCALCKWPEIPGPIFYLTRWELEDFEKEAFASRLQDLFHSQFDGIDPEKAKAFIKSVVDNFPQLYLSAMHTPPPVMIMAYDPFQELGMTPDDESAEAVSPKGKEGRPE